MTLASQPYRIIETAARRVPGAFQFVDAVTETPLDVAAGLEIRGATVGAPPEPAAVGEGNLRIRRNRRGVYVVFDAPFFGEYTEAFDDPHSPAKTQSGPLRLHLAIADAGPYYLPQEFDVDLPRPLDPHVAGNVFAPQPVPLFRAPNAPVQDGWTLLRVRVTAAGITPENGLPGVLVRVFRQPRVAGDLPIGKGMTDWRGNIRGEALVPIAGLQRFRPGEGEHVVATDYAIEFEATRDPAFTGAVGQLPNVPRIVAGTGTGIIRPPAQPPGSELTMLKPAAPLRVQAGRQYTVQLAMP